LVYRELKGYFVENVISRDLELGDHVYKEKMYLSLVTILLEDFPFIWFIAILLKMSKSP